MSTTFKKLFAILAALVVLSQGVMAQTSVAVTLGNLEQVYDGTVKLPSVSTQPGNVAVQMAITQTPVTAVFRNTPANPSLTYLETAYPQTLSTAHTYALGGGYTIPADRRLESIDLILVNRAKASSWPALAQSNPAGYFHEVRVRVHEVMSNGAIPPSIMQVTQNVLIPWLPESIQNGSAYPATGIAVPVKFRFPWNAATLPQNLAVMVDFNTQSHGYIPIGTAGPYNLLGLGFTQAAPAVGTDALAGEVYWRAGENGGTLYRTAFAGYGSLMLSVNTFSSQAPVPAEPRQGGVYIAKATVTSPGYAGEKTETFRVLPASATVSLSNLTQVFNGSPRPISATTTPASLPVVFSYNGSASAPSAVGNYPVIARIDSLNYTGSAIANLFVGHQLSSWIQAWVTAGQIPPAEATASADPDKDGITNLLEYAFALNPASPVTSGVNGTGLPVFTRSGNNVSLQYRRNLDAIDLTYQIEASTDLGATAPWTIVTGTDTIVSTVGSVRTVRTTLPISNGQPRRFYRLKVTQGTP